MLCVVVVVLVLLIYHAIDDALGHDEFDRGSYVALRHRAAYTSLVLVGKITVPQHHPAQYWAVVRTQRHGDVDVWISRTEHEQGIAGETDVVVRIGRWSGAISSARRVSR